MTRQLILIRYGELGLKGKNRHLFVGRLANNIRSAMKGLPDWQVKVTWGRLWLDIAAEHSAAAISRLQRVYGIYSVSPVVESERSIEAMAAHAYEVLRLALPQGGTFKMETRRTDKTFPMTSPDISRTVAGLVFDELEKAGEGRFDADMHHPDATINIEVRAEGVFIFGQTIRCAGGLPVGCSGKAAVMLSGGIDSPVAAALAMKRGASIEAIHFHSFPFTGEKAKEKVYELSKILARIHGAPIKLHMIYFTDIQKAIYASCPEEYGITVMRRFMYRIAEKVARQRNCLALYTGESVGQVASQTLESLFVINDAINMPILRPLVGMDKEEIMARAKELGTYETSILPFEDCCTVFLPEYPKIRPVLEEVLEMEKALDIAGLIDDALSKSEMLTING